VHEVGLGAKLGWELGEAVARIQFDAIVSTATGVGWLEGAVVGRAVECHELIAAVSDTLQGAAGSIDHSVGPTGLAAVSLGLANDLLWNFDDTVKDVTDGTAEFAGRCVFSSWRGLDVCVNRHSKAQCECDQKELFHYEVHLTGQSGSWQCENHRNNTILDRRNPAGFRIVIGWEVTRVPANPMFRKLQIGRVLRILSLALLVPLLAGGDRIRAAESYIAVEAYSGKILLELDADRKRPVASLAKIATAMVVLDWAALSKTSMADMAVVPAEAGMLGGSNPMGLVPGDRISLREAMYSMLLGSDNVAAYTLASYAGRSIQARNGGASPVAAFVGEMNNLARALKMTRTKFVNPHGMDTAKQKGFSSARDMARLSIYAMRNTGFKFYVKQRSRTIASYRGGQKRAFKVGNTHKLIGRGDVNGIKTGTTVLAGDCAATSSEKKPIVQKLENGASRLTGRRLIIVTLGSADRWGITQTLINQGWWNYEAWRQQGSPVANAREILNVQDPQ